MAGIAQPDIEQMISAMDCGDETGCRKARRALVAMGEAAVPALIQAANSDKLMVKWEAVKALSAFNLPSSINALIEHLHDPDYGVRWLSAEGLAKVGEATIEPVLKALIESANSSPFRHGVHRYLTEIESKVAYQEILTPVRETLEEPVAYLAAPVAASKALDELRVFRRQINK